MTTNTHCIHLNSIQLLAENKEKLEDNTSLYYRNHTFYYMKIFIFLIIQR